MFIQIALIVSKKASMDLLKSAGGCVYVNTPNTQGE